MSFPKPFLLFLLIFFLTVGVIVGSFWGEISWQSRPRALTLIGNTFSSLAAVDRLAPALVIPEVNGESWEASATAVVPSATTVISEETRQPVSVVLRGESYRRLP